MVMIYGEKQICRSDLENLIRSSILKQLQGICLLYRFHFPFCWLNYSIFETFWHCKHCAR